MCALVVEGLPEYHTQVETALEQICPGVTVDPVTGVVKKTADCVGYCAHVAGCNLLDDLIDSKTTTGEVKGFKFKIRPFSIAQYTDLENAKFPGIVWWSDGADSIPATDNCSSTCADPADDIPVPAVAGLAHELIHAWHDLNGTYCLGIDNEESCTVCAENQIRAEIGLPPRCSYLNVCIPCAGEIVYPDCSVLGGAEKYQCLLLEDFSKRTECDCTIKIPPDPDPGEHECKRCPDGSWVCARVGEVECEPDACVDWVTMDTVTIPIGVGRELAICVRHRIVDADKCTVEVKLDPCIRTVVAKCENLLEKGHTHG